MNLTGSRVDSPTQRPHGIAPDIRAHAQLVNVGGESRARARAAARPCGASGRATHARAAVALRAAEALAIPVGLSAGLEARSGARAVTAAMAAEEEEVDSADTCERLVWPRLRGVQDRSFHRGPGRAGRRSRGLVPRPAPLCRPARREIALRPEDAPAWLCPCRAREWCESYPAAPQDLRAEGPR